MSKDFILSSVGELKAEMRLLEAYISQGILSWSCSDSCDLERSIYRVIWTLQNRFDANAKIESAQLQPIWLHCC
jgi:hypothetical protein